MRKWIGCAGSLIIALVFTNCETVIRPELEQASPQYIVDAFINNKLDTQVISLSFTQPYFEAEVPPPVSGATVHVSDNAGNDFLFVEHPARKGAYIWVPDTVGFGVVGRQYTLSILANGEHFTSTSRMGRVPSLDSISFKSNDRTDGSGVYYIGQFWAKDPAGPGDTYWIKAFKNGVLLDRPEEINLAYDAAFSKGSGFDGFEFIQPIRQGINRFDTDDSDRIISPYVLGDSVYVEIHSLTEASFDFLTQVWTQTNRPGGFAELFSRPLANVSTNIANQNAGGAKVQGFFNVGSVSGRGQKFDKVSTW